LPDVWQLRDMSKNVKSSKRKTTRDTVGVAAEQLRLRLQQNSTSRQMGFTLAQASRGRVRLQMKVDARHLQVHGVVHGGVLAALADTAGGLASYMSCPLGTRVATVEMKINYLEGVERGTVTADAEVVRIGRHLAVVDCDVTDDAKRLVAKALMTFFVGPFAEPRKR
jgi:1,4-dihydroxy-2-naphthoyl-CoA hydrolase